MDDAVEQMCISQMPGDTYRDLQVDADYSAQTFKHILLPVWMLSYVYRRPQLPGRGQRLHRKDRRRVSAELDQGHDRHRHRAHHPVLHSIARGKSLIRSRRIDAQANKPSGTGGSVGAVHHGHDAGPVLARG